MTAILKSVNLIDMTEEKSNKRRNKLFEIYYRNAAQKIEILVE